MCDPIQHISNGTQFVELCWFFPMTQEQYRFSGTAIVIDSDTTEEHFQQQRLTEWKSLSHTGRLAYEQPTPGAPQASTEVLGDLDQVSSYNRPRAIITISFYLIR
jgi:hypothetical protein